MASSTDDSSSSLSESSSGETKQISRTSSRFERCSNDHRTLQRKSRSRSQSRGNFKCTSNVLQKSYKKIDRGLPDRFPGQDCRDQGDHQARGKEDSRPETRGIPVCIIVHDQIHRINLQETFVKLTRTPRLAVLKHLIKRLRKPTRIQDRRLQRQLTSRNVSWFMLTACSPPFLLIRDCSQSNALFSIVRYPHFDSGEKKVREERGPSCSKADQRWD